MTQVEQDKQLVIVSDELTSLLASKIKACPENFNQTRFLQNCLVALQGIDPVKLAKVTPRSVALTMIKGAFLGLDFANKECYAIPFGDQLQFLTDYKGDIKLCRQYAVKPIKDIYAKVVREGDSFDHKIVDGLPLINFTPLSPFNDAAIIGAFAVVIYEDGIMAYEAMSKKEIEATRANFSKCSTSPAWRNAWGEMAKKTVLKRVTKMVEICFKNPEQTKAFQEGSDLKKESIDVQAEEVIDPFKKTMGVDPATKGEDKSVTTNPEETDDDKILKIQATIENHLKAMGKEKSLIFKYSTDLCNGKKLHELNLAEITELRDKILGGTI
ncbi:hypothetical protein LCGC14_1599500 [marine sediment metagenome]|uniref:Recombinase RecT n=1 Tax=marine sediment metagenome TaxID=412755 RepID=A0A0F9LBN1_9ZZZZ